MTELMHVFEYYSLGSSGTGIHRGSSNGILGFSQVYISGRGL